MSLADAFKRHTLWIGFTAALVPLIVLLVLQYRWLVELDHTSTVARQATLDNYLQAVATEVYYFYTAAGERALNLPSTLFTQKRLDKATYHFQKKSPEGARRLFVVSFVDPEERGTPRFFEPCTGTPVEPPWSEVRAAYVAAAPWGILAKKGGALEAVSLSVEERDPEHRILLNPITDDSSRVVGLAGMVIDETYFKEELLPQAISEKLPKFFPGGRDHDPIVAVHDNRGRPVFTTGTTGEKLEPEVKRRFSFVFTDWKMGLGSRHASPGEWARTNFVLNVALSAALAVVLLGGLALALAAASRAMRLSQLKSDFVSNVSHELRTPLASIRVFGELLRHGKVESMAKAREYGEYIETESRRLTQLINNLLDFASIESGRKSYRFERVDLTEIVQATLRTFEVRLRQMGFKVYVDRKEADLPPVWADPGAVAQSLSNLVDNAVKYSNGGREIAVSLAREGNDFVVLSVRDWGIGIPRAEQGKIFDRFHRVSTGLVHDVKGSGLGLAIVRHIAEAHGGRVSVDSRSGAGSTFSLHLPVAPRERPAAKAEVAGPGLEPGRAEA